MAEARRRLASGRAPSRKSTLRLMRAIVRSSLWHALSKTWGGPPGPRPTPSSACCWHSSTLEVAGPGGPARTRGSAPLKCACAAILVVACLFADTHADIIDVFTAMAAALSDTNVPEFMGAFDKNMPGYGKLKTDVTALMTQADISSSIEPIKDEGDDRSEEHTSELQPHRH